MSKAPFDKQYTKGKSSEGNKPHRAMKGGNFEDNPTDVQMVSKAAGSRSSEMFQPRQRMSSLKANVMRHLGQRK